GDSTGHALTAGAAAAPRPPPPPRPPRPPPRPNSCRSALVAGARSIGSAFTYPESATIWMTPPLVFIAISISSSMLREWLASLRMPECDAMTGAFDRPIACIIDPFDGCETSTMMPHRFISWMTWRPSGDRPPHIHWLFASPVFESDSWLWPLWASDM